MHRQKHGAGPNALGDLHLHRHHTAARPHLGPGPINQAGASRIAWMHLQQRLGVGLKRPRHMGRAGHGVPVAQHPPHREHQGIGVAGGFG